MALVTIRTHKNKVVDDFIEKTDKRINQQQMLQKGYAKSLHIDDDNYVVVNISPIVPEFILLRVAVFLFIVLFIIFGRHWTLLIPILIGLLTYFYSTSFIYKKLVKGLRAAGYEGKIDKIENEKYIEVIYDVATGYN